MPKPKNDSTSASIVQQRNFLKARLWAESPPFESDQQKGLPGSPVETPPPDGCEQIALPAVKTLTCGQMPLRQAIGQRRSRRRFSQTPLTLEELAYICWATLGIQKIFGDGVAVYRTVPSAGARHALQLYVAAAAGQGFDSGLYRYQAAEHTLAKLYPDAAIMQKIAQACCDQRWMAQAAAVLILTAVPYRMEWRYGPASPKLIALDAGHACQNLCLAAESIGAGACAVAAYHQQQADRLLGVDGRDEFVMYLAAVGKV